MPHRPTAAPRRPSRDPRVRCRDAPGCSDHDRRTGQGPGFAPGSPAAQNRRPCCWTNPAMPRDLRSTGALPQEHFRLGTVVRLISGDHRTGLSHTQSGPVVGEGRISRRLPVPSLPSLGGAAGPQPLDPGKGEHHGCMPPTVAVRVRPGIEPGGPEGPSTRPMDGNRVDPVPFASCLAMTLL